jgi:hypothetical protein
VAKDQPQSVVILANDKRIESSESVSDLMSLINTAASGFFEVHDTHGTTHHVNTRQVVEVQEPRSGTTQFG